MAKLHLIFSDLIISFMWVCSGALIKIFVYKFLGLGFHPEGEVIKGALSILNMFFFAWLYKISSGGSYNPLSILSGAISGSFSSFLYTVGARIPCQVIGSIIGVKLIKEAFPGVGSGPRLNTDIHQGALIEGLLTFVIVMVSCELRRHDPNSFFMKTWILSVSKLSLHILGSDLTGGCMNPASAMGWAYARGDHLTKEHLYVYWLAPLEATLLGAWTFRLLLEPQKPKQEQKQLEKVNEKSKSE